MYKLENPPPPFHNLVHLPRTLTPPPVAQFIVCHIKGVPVAASGVVFLRHKWGIDRDGVHNCSG